MFCVAASSALFLPFLRAASPNRRLVGMSISSYTYVGIVVLVALALGLAVVAIAEPQ